MIVMETERNGDGFIFNLCAEEEPDTSGRYRLLQVRLTEEGIVIDCYMSDADNHSLVGTKAVMYGELFDEIAGKERT